MTIHIGDKVTVKWEAISIGLEDEGTGAPIQTLVIRPYIDDANTQWVFHMLGSQVPGRDGINALHFHPNLDSPKY